MIYRYKNGQQKEITSISKYPHVVTAVYHVRNGLHLVWELIKSCFGRGYWVNSAPYVNNDAWKN